MKEKKKYAEPKIERFSFGCDVICSSATEGVKWNDDWNEFLQ